MSQPLTADQIYDGYRLIRVAALPKNNFRFRGMLGGPGEG
jgi:hypothetical protein